MVERDGAHVVLEPLGHAGVSGRALDHELDELRRRREARVAVEHLGDHHLGERIHLGEDGHVGFPQRGRHAQERQAGPDDAAPERHHQERIRVLPRLHGLVAADVEAYEALQVGVEEHQVEHLGLGRRRAPVLARRGGLRVLHDVVPRIRLRVAGVPCRYVGDEVGRHLLGVVADVLVEVVADAAMHAGVAAVALEPRCPGLRANERRHAGDGGLGALADDPEVRLVQHARVLRRVGCGAGSFAQVVKVEGLRSAVGEAHHAAHDVLLLAFEQAHLHAVVLVDRPHLADLLRGQRTVRRHGVARLHDVLVGGEGGQLVGVEIGVLARGHIAGGVRKLGLHGGIVHRGLAAYVPHIAIPVHIRVEDLEVPLLPVDGSRQPKGEIALAAAPTCVNDGAVELRHVVGPDAYRVLVGVVLHAAHEECSGANASGPGAQSNGLDVLHHDFGRIGTAGRSGRTCLGGGFGEAGLGGTDGAPIGNRLLIHCTQTHRSGDDIRPGAAPVRTARDVGLLRDNLARRKGLVVGNGRFLFGLARLLGGKDVFVGRPLCEGFERSLDGFVVLRQTLLYFARETTVLVKAIATRIFRASLGNSCS